MIWLNEIYKLNIHNEALAKTFSQLLMPFAPHLAEEVWELLGGKGFVSLAPWPKHDKALSFAKKARIGVQINGRARGSIELDFEDTEEEALKKALKLKNIQKFIQDKKIKKCIYKQGKILSLIV